jgi:CheY-like chemotaxis protein
MPQRWILIVDDDMIQAASVSDFLESHGFSVTTANDAQQAVLQAESLNPVLVIMDMQMPVFGTGADAVRAMRSIPQLSRTPVIIMTGMQLDKARALLSPDPLLRLMSKPPDWPALLAAVNSFLKPSSLGQTLPGIPAGQTLPGAPAGQTLPGAPPGRTQPEAPARQTQPPAPAFVRKPCTALLILDDVAVLGSVRGAFQLGDTLYSATNGADALAYIQRTKVELIVTELFLPRFSGLELLRAVQTDPDLKDLPFIVLTGSRLADRDTTLLRKEFPNLQAVFVKPVSQVELRKSITDTLRRRV